MRIGSGVWLAPVGGVLFLFWGFKVVKYVTTISAPIALRDADLMAQTGCKPPSKL